MGDPARRFAGWPARVLLLFAASLQMFAEPTRAASPPASQAAQIGVVDARASLDGPRTTFSVEFTHMAEPAVFLVADPPRLVIDIANADFRLPPAAGAQRTGLVAGFRFGLLAPGRSRIVMDLAGPAVVAKAEMSARAQGRIALVVTLVPTDEGTFRGAAGTGIPLAAASPPPARSEPPVAGRASSPKGAPRPLIVIDPGHGGVDPGAVGKDGVLEKTIVLDVAKQLKLLLANRQKYEVVLTRADDRFIPLDRRVEISEGAKADLFISLHADSLEATDVASTVRGATVYTLSDKASDEQARRLAEKENAADVLAGLGAAIGSGVDDPVRNILVDLLKQETTEFSSMFRTLLVPELAKSIALSKDPTRAAAFRVLRQTQTPSVLIELGYMSNVEDQKLMATPTWQRNVAGSIAAAVDRFFERRTQISGR